MGKDSQFVDASTANSFNENTQLCDFCTEKLSYSNASWQACIKSPDVFIKLLKFGRLRGIVNIIGCKKTDIKQDYILLAKELINREFLVTASGCIAVDMEKAGLIGADAFQWASEGLTELCEYLGIEPGFYMGSCKDNTDMLTFYKLLADRLGSETKDLPMAVITLQQHQEQSAISDLHGGTIFHVEDDYVKTADTIDVHIHNKRIGLEWCDRFHCSGEKYS